MSIFYHKSISTIETNLDGKKMLKTVKVSTNGKKKKMFEIIKEKNGEIEKVKGITPDNNSEQYNVQKDIIKKNKSTGKIHSIHSEFTLKTSNLINLLKDSDMIHQEKSSIKNEKKLSDNKKKTKSLQKSKSDSELKQKSISKDKTDIKSSKSSPRKKSKKIKSESDTK
jgi:hypothetical protein